MERETEYSAQGRLRWWTSFRQRSLIIVLLALILLLSRCCCDCCCRLHPLPIETLKGSIHRVLGSAVNTRPNLRMGTFGPVHNMYTNHGHRMGAVRPPNGSTLKSAPDLGQFGAGFGTDSFADNTQIGNDIPQIGDDGGSPGAPSTGGPTDPSSCEGICYQVGPSSPSGSVPEPGTWAMMLAGFLMVGATVRHRVAVA